MTSCSSGHRLRVRAVVRPLGLSLALAAWLATGAALAAAPTQAQLENACPKFKQDYAAFTTMTAAAAPAAEPEVKKAKKTKRPPAEPAVPAVAPPPALHLEMDAGAANILNIDGEAHAASVAAFCDAGPEQRDAAYLAVLAHDGMKPQGAGVGTILAAVADRAIRGTAALVADRFQAELALWMMTDFGRRLCKPAGPPGPLRFERWFPKSCEITSNSGEQPSGMLAAAFRADLEALPGVILDDLLAPIGGDGVAALRVAVATMTHLRAGGTFGAALTRAIEKEKFTCDAQHRVACGFALLQVLAPRLKDVVGEDGRISRDDVLALLQSTDLGDALKKWAAAMEPAGAATTPRAGAGASPVASSGAATPPAGAATTTLAGTGAPAAVAPAGAATPASTGATLVGPAPPPAAPAGTPRILSIAAAVKAALAGAGGALEPAKYGAVADALLTMPGSGGEPNEVANIFAAIETLSAAATDKDEEFVRLALTPEQWQPLDQFHEPSRTAVEHFARAEWADGGRAVLRVLVLLGPVLEQKLKESKQPKKVRRAQTDTLRLVVRTLSFLVDAANAKTPEEFRAALDSAAAPLGGWRRKTRGFVASLGAMAGLTAGAELLLEGGKARPGAYIAPQAMLGLDLAAPVCRHCKRRSSLGGFVSVLDVGQLASQRLAGDVKDDLADTMGVEGVEEKPTIGVAQVLSPGLYGRLGIAETPITLLVGFCFVPDLRATRSAAWGPAIDAWVMHVGASLSVDITLFPFGRRR
jgi:hypothetical protein